MQINRPACPACLHCKVREAREWSRDAVAFPPGSIFCCVIDPGVGGEAATAPPLARGQWPDARPATPASRESPAWPDDWAAVLYVDNYGNAVTGLRAAAVPKDGIIAIRGNRVRSARVFGEVAKGAAFWYENANGPVEIAVREGNAAQRFGLRPGDPVVIVDDAGRAAG